MHVLVVDDNSPDGTGDAVRELMAAYPWLHLITGEKQGLGAAYIRGMIYALKEFQAEAVMEMDADFSHLPADVPRLARRPGRRADFVIGSRYIPGAAFRKTGVGCGRPFPAGAMSLPATWPGSTGQGCTAGFRAIRAALLRRIDFNTLAAVQGYAFQITLLNQALINKAVIAEIPVVFVDRVHGATKLGLGDIVEFLLDVWWIRFQACKTFLKFAAVGATGVVVNLGLFMRWFRSV